MRTTKKITKIGLNVLPLIAMILLIFIVNNDYFLSLIFILIIAGSFAVKYEKRDYFFLIVGIIFMTISEYVFLLTGVEKFNRRTFLGVMPIWLSVLWGYAFFVIKRTIKILS